MQQPWNPNQLLKLSGSYWQTAILHASVVLDIYTHLEAQSMSTQQLSQRLKCDERGLNMLLNGLCALELLNKCDDKYQNVDFSLKYLVKSSPDYLGHIIKHHHHLTLPWAQLPSAILEGGPIRQQTSKTSSEQERESFLMGMFNLASLLAPTIVDKIDLSAKSNLLDLAGGPGTYAIEFCKKNPNLIASVLDLPTTKPFAIQTIEKFNLQDKINFISGDIFEVNFEGPYDVAWLSHILHSEGPSQCSEIIKKVYDCLSPQGEIIIHEFILDDDEIHPPFAAFFSLNMYLGTPKGRSYSFSSLKQMLTSAGFTNVELITIAPEVPSRIIKATKTTS